MSDSSYGARHGAGAHAAEASGLARNRQIFAIAVVTAAAVAVATACIGLAGAGPTNAIESGMMPQAQLRAAASGSPEASQPTLIPATLTAPAHNPFKPLVTPSAGAAGGASTASATAPVVISNTPEPPPPTIIFITPTPSDTPPPETPTPTPTPTATVTVTSTATPTATPTGLPTAGQAITLTLDAVDLTAGTVDVTVVNGSTTTQYTGLEAGKVFGTYFKVVSILSSDPASPPVVGKAGFQYGDQFVQLAQGESAHLA